MWWFFGWRVLPETLRHPRDLWSTSPIFCHQIDHLPKDSCEVHPVWKLTKPDAPNTRLMFLCCGEVDIGVTNNCKVILIFYIFLVSSIASFEPFLKRIKNKSHKQGMPRFLHKCVKTRKPKILQQLGTMCMLWVHPFFHGPFWCVGFPSRRGNARWRQCGRWGYRGCGGSQHGVFLHSWYGCPGFEFQQLLLPHEIHCFCWTASPLSPCFKLDSSFVWITAIWKICEHFLIHEVKKKQTITKTLFQKKRRI